MTGAAVKFKEAMAAEGYHLPGDPVSDGTLHRFPHEDRTGGTAGWYVFHADGIPAGSYGDWRSGRTFTWCAKGESEFTSAEREDFRRRIEQQKAERQRAEHQARAEAASRARQAWDTARPASPDHPYLSKKGVKAYGIRQDTNGRLLIPVRDPDGNLTSLQTIDNGGGKLFLPGGRKRGCCHSIKGKDPAVFNLCEGYATGATIHEANGDNVVICFDAGNLLPVAEAIREKHPAARIVICADDDRWTSGNPGVTKATEAAAKVNGIVLSPTFKDVNTRPTDFNDLAALEGIEEVRRQVENRTRQEKPLFPPWEELSPVSEAVWANSKLSPRCIVNQYLYADVGQIVGPGSAGKTTLLLYEIVHIALGLQLYGLEVKTPGKTLYITAEDSAEFLLARLWRVVSAMGLTPGQRDQVRRDVVFVDLSDRGSMGKLIKLSDGNIVETDTGKLVIKAYQDKYPVMVIFDPMVSFGASESRFNDNEQGLMTAARQISRKMDCCVRFIHHTGKESARNKTVDQYSGRGGSAMSDGCRMVTVMQPWGSKDSERPPEGCRPDNDSSIARLARPKVSYAKPNLAMIWIKRTDWSYEYFLERPASETEEFSAFCNQIVQYVRSQESFNHFPSKNSIQTFMATTGKKQKTTRDAIDTLLAEARLIIKTKPAGERAPGPKSYIGTPGKGDNKANETSENEGSDTMDEETQGTPGQEDGVDLVKISTTANEVSENKGSDTMDESPKKNTSLPIGNKDDDEVSSPPFPVILETSLTESTKSDEVNEVLEEKNPDITSGGEPECLARSGDGVEVPEATPPDIPPGGGEWEMEL